MKPGTHRDGDTKFEVAQLGMRKQRRICGGEQDEGGYSAPLSEGSSQTAEAGVCRDSFQLQTDKTITDLYLRVWILDVHLFCYTMVYRKHRIYIDLQLSVLHFHQKAANIQQVSIRRG